MNNFTPEPRILKNLADTLIKFALNSGEGIKKGEVVYVMMNEWSKPMLLPMQKAILEAGGHMILSYLPAELERDRDETRQFFELASEDQINFFPREYIQARINTVDHFVLLLSTGDHNYYEGIDLAKINQRNIIWREYMNMRSKKEYEGKLTWVLTDYPTPEMASAANLTIEEYWDQVIKACYLNEENPIETQKASMDKIHEIVKWINDLGIEELHVEGEDVDLTVGLTEHQQFVGGSGRNIPSFEIFTSPDTRKTNGWIKFNQPLYRNGQVMKGIRLEFKDGVIVNSSAEENYEALKAMIETDGGARRVGEFSLTDKRFSKIDKIMANTLYDENFGGEFGNTHIAIGQSYKDCIKDQEKFSDAELLEFGFNNSAIHTDIISTTNRKVTAKLRNGETRVIYEDGEFRLAS